ncbi:Retinol dehydrogenase 1 [Carabus blaptoides fortunei]
MHYVCYVFPTLGVILVLVRKYQEYKWGKCTNSVSLRDKVVLITGANSGIGYETAKELARRGAKVILACRDMDKAIGAITRIQQSLQSCNNLVPMQLDLGSLHSVQAFVEELSRTESQIDILINNAGVSYPKSKDEVQRTSDGFEIHFGVNHLGHYLLTRLLLPKLRAAAPGSRVIIVSSLLHQKANIYLADLNAVSDAHTPTRTPEYNNSKLANAYFGCELAARVQQDGVGVYTVCPGWVYTGLFRNHHIRWYHYPLGAQTLVHCATEPELASETGKFYRNCAPYQSTVQFSADTAQRLWMASEQIIVDAGIKLQ